ncbi:MAG TPA: hypothetical protein VMB53_15395 [Gaiellaceae bacterium]|nr:hypothetical protein [Gaiellaceae bacterium]
MLRVRLVIPLAVLAVLVAAGTAQARTVPSQPPFRVLVFDHLTQSQYHYLAKRGAVGLLVPGVGPTTNRRQALAEMLRGSEVNARLGGVPSGPRLITASAASGYPTGCCFIVVELPPKGAPAPNDQRYRVVVVGRGYHGVLTSPTTRIPGLVSIVDIAPTVIGHSRGALGSQLVSNPTAAVASLNRQIHANNRLKFAALLVAAGFALFFLLLRSRAAITVIPAVLLGSLGLAIAQVTNEILIMTVLSLACFLGGLWLARVCKDDLRLLALFVGVLLLHMLLLARRPEWVAVSPLGPTQNTRFWGIGNQLETLLIAPLLLGATISRRLFGTAGFAAFAMLSLWVITGNKFGSDGGGAIVLGVAFAFLGARLLRIGARGFVTLLLTAATVVLGIVWLDLRVPGPNHLRSAFGHGLTGLWNVAVNRVPLSYAPALHAWTLILPIAISFVVTMVIAYRLARRHPARDLVLAVGVAVVTSLLVNDSAGYVLSGGIACAAAVARFVPSYSPLRLPVLSRAPLVPQPVANEATSE